MRAIIRDGGVYYLDLLPVVMSHDLEEPFLYREWFMSPRRALAVRGVRPPPLEALKEVEIGGRERILDLGCDWGIWRC